MQRRSVLRKNSSRKNKYLTSFPIGFRTHGDLVKTFISDLRAKGHGGESETDGDECVGDSQNRRMGNTSF